MVTVKSAEKVKDGLVEPDPTQNEDAHWFFYTPCAGVTYYAFEARPTKSKRVESPSSDDTPADAE